MQIVLCCQELIRILRVTSAGLPGGLKSLLGGLGGGGGGGRIRALHGAEDSGIASVMEDSGIALGGFEQFGRIQ